jgi:hypothetical protein
MDLHEIDPALDPALDQLTRRKFVKRAGAGAAAAAAAAVGGCAKGNEADKAVALADSAQAQEEVSFKSGNQDI